MTEEDQHKILAYEGEFEILHKLASENMARTMVPIPECYTRAQEYLETRDLLNKRRGSKGLPAAGMTEKERFKLFQKFAHP